MSSHHDGDLDPILRYAPPRARAQGQPPPKSAAPPVDRPSPSQPANSAEFSGDRAIVGMRQRLALEPEWVPEPPEDTRPRRALWIFSLHASGVLGGAALLAWVVVSIPSVTQLGRYVVPATSPRTLVSTNSQTVVPPSGMASPVAIVASAAATSSVVTKVPPEPPHPTVAIAELPTPEARGRPNPRVQRDSAPSADAANIQSPQDQQTSPAEQARPTHEATMAEQRSAPEFVATRQFDRDELASMLRRADDFIKTGDLSSARLLLRRAAEAGSEQAALTLAGTFDPNILAALGLQDGAADTAMARLWYERAERFGSSEAPRRLRELATNSVPAEHGGK